MRLELTVLPAAGPDDADDGGDRAGGCGRGVDVVVEAPAGTPLGDVLPALADLARGAGPGGRTGAPPQVPPGAAVASAGGQRLRGCAPLGSPPLVRGAVVLLGPGGSSDGPDAAPGAPGAPGAASVLSVVAGPGAGRAAEVPLGRAVVGRSPTSLLPLADRAASRHHVEVDTTPRGTRVRDAGSANGTLLDGRPLPPAWTPLPLGARLRLGASEVVLTAPATGPARRRTPDGRGHLLLAAPPSTAAGTTAGGAPRGAVETAVVELPARPRVPSPSPTSWAAVLVPVVVAVPLALLWSPLALLMALSGPLVAVLTRATDRRTRRRRHAADLVAHAAAVAEGRARGADLLDRERRRVEDEHPDPAALLTAVRVVGQRVWSAAPGGPLAVRLGTGTVPSGVVLRTAAAHGGGDGEGEVLQHAPGPVVVDLRALAVVDVEAPDDVALAVARCVVGQLAALHPPSALRVRVETDRPAAWSWLRWLPHAAGGQGPGRGPGADAGPGPALLVVHDGPGRAGAAGPVDGTTVLRLLPAGGRGDGPPPGGAPAADAVLRLDAGGAGTWSGPGLAGLAGPDGRDGRDGPGELVADQVGPGWAGALARGLAPLREPGRGLDPGEDGADGGDPSLRDLLAAHGPDPVDAVAVAAAWRSGRRSRAVPLGVHEDGRPWLVDLARDGPHALLAGTTGSGKSSLLVALVLALAVAAPPDELAVVVVDYKGGSTAGRLHGLPHLAGTVTDLDEHLARRALASLGAEVRRRERTLREHGAADREELLARRPDGARLLPRLLVVVDEVRVLAEQVPELVPGLVRLAAVGRSLGVHLVLATQRPAGVVSADARANTNLRVALRVRDVADSVDVVDDPGAAALRPSAPGSALVRRGGEALEAVRVAPVGSLPATPVVVRVLDPGGAPQSPPPVRGDDVPLVVAALAEAARGTPAAAPPWLPQLPDVLPWRSPAQASVEAADDGPQALTGLALALVDEPEVPARSLLRWPADHPLVVAGGPRSGRTSLLRWLAVAAGDGASGGPQRRVHVIGSPGEVADLAALPWVDSVVDPSDGEHLLRVLGAALGATPPADAPAPVLLVDGADRLLAGGAAPGLDPAGRAEADAAADLLRRLLERAAPVVLAADPALLTQRAAAGVREVLLLAPADPSAALLVGVPRADVPVHWPAGRALRLRGGAVRECQLPLLGGSDGVGDPAEQHRVVAAVAASAVAASAVEPTTVRARTGPVPALPRRLEADDLDALLDARERADRDRDCDPVAVAGARLAVGVGGSGAVPLALDLPAGARALVAGPPGSGRTGLLTHLAQRAAREGRPVVLVRPGSGGAGSAEREPGIERVTGTAAVDVGLLQAALERGGGPLVLVDDLELVLGTPLERALQALLDDDPARCALVAAGTSGQLSAHRAPVASLRRHRTGVLLHPLAPGDAELLGVRASPVRGGPPGRASLVVGGELTVVQLALPGALPAGWP